MKHFEIFRIIVVIGLVLVTLTVANPLDVEDEGFIFLDGSGSGSGLGASEVELMLDSNLGDGSGSGGGVDEMSLLTNAILGDGSGSGGGDEMSLLTNAILGDGSGSGTGDEMPLLTSNALGDGSGSGGEEVPNSLSNPEVFTTSTTSPASTTTATVVSSSTSTTVTPSTSTSTTTTENPILDEEFLSNSLPTNVLNSENIDLIDGSSTQTTTTTTVAPTSTSEIIIEDANEGLQLVQGDVLKEEIVIVPKSFPVRKYSKTIHKGPLKTRTRRNLNGSNDVEDSSEFYDEMEQFESDFGVQTGSDEQDTTLSRLKRSPNSAKSLLAQLLEKRNVDQQVFQDRLRKLITNKLKKM